MYKCSKCDNFFSNYDNLEYHYKNCNNNLDKSYKCIKCDKLYSNYDDLEYHKQFCKVIDINDKYYKIYYY